MKFNCIIFYLSFFSFCTAVSAQKEQPKIKFGDVKPEDFAPKVYSIDSSADAIVIADIGSSVFVGNNNGDFSLIFKHHKRIRMMNKNGFNEATIEIPLYMGSNGLEERLEKLEAVTYNLENGKVVATSLDKASIFKDKQDEHHVLRKFTFPNIKEGSIIEFNYTVNSPYYFNLQPWRFQGDIPRLWSEYTVTVPVGIFDYVTLRNGNLPYAIDTSVSSIQSYNILFRGTYTNKSLLLRIRSNTVKAHWALKDIPSLKPVTYITSLDNYISKIDFQLRRIKYSDTNIEEYMGNWNQLVDRLMKREDFGAELFTKHGWMDNELNNVLAGTKDEYEKAIKVYHYFQNNYTTTKNYGIYTDKPLKKVYQDKNGTAAGLNLLLVVAFNSLGYKATPAMLSTRENGKAHETYPIVGEYNSVLCRLNIGGNYYLLDAADKTLGFGKLSPDKYNGSARVIDSIPILVDLSADSILESSITSLFLVNEGKNIIGAVSEKYGNFGSIDMRQKLSKMKPEEYLKEIKGEYGIEVDLTNIEIDSLKIPEEPLELKYEIKFSMNDEDLIYFNPMLTAIVKTNPFASAERIYPVEMNACKDEIFILNMEVPSGYKVDELPKSTRVSLNETDGMFEYIIAENAGHIQMRCRIKLNKANFIPDDYQTLRDFFAFIVKKEAEQVVFKKIK